eukprot:jgi/Mesvir1/22030/Mv15915-RA.1
MMHIGLIRDPNKSSNGDSKVRLLKIAVFDRRRGHEEGHEEEGILCFFPPSEPLDAQKALVGLSDALITFSSTFSSQAPPHALTTDRRRQVFFQCEPDIWMVLVAEAPPRSELQVRDEALRNILRDLHRQYTLFHGPLRLPVSEDDLPALVLCKAQLAALVEDYVEDLVEESRRLSSRYSPAINALREKGGVSMLPCGHETLLQVQSMVASIEMKLDPPVVRHTVVLQGNHLVWSGIDLKSTAALTTYAVNYILPSSPAMKPRASLFSLAGGGAQAPRPRSRPADRHFVVPMPTSGASAAGRSTPHAGAHSAGVDGGGRGGVPGVGGNRAVEEGGVEGARFRGDASARTSWDHTRHDQHSLHTSGNTRQDDDGDDGDDDSSTYSWGHQPGACAYPRDSVCVGSPFMEWVWHDGDSGFHRASSACAGGLGGAGRPACPRIHLPGHAEHFQLLVFQKLGLTFLLLVADNAATARLLGDLSRLWESLHQQIGSQAQEIGVAFQKQLASFHGGHIKGYRYLYIDRMHMAVRGSPEDKAATLSSATLSALNQLRIDMDNAVGLTPKEDRSTQHFEACCKTKQGAWVVARRNGSQELYVVLEKGCESLMDACGAVDEFNNRYFDGIFSTTYALPDGTEVPFCERFKLLAGACSLTDTTDNVETCIGRPGLGQAPFSQHLLPHDLKPPIAVLSDAVHWSSKSAGRSRSSLPVEEARRLSSKWCSTLMSRPMYDEQNARPQANTAVPAFILRKLPTFGIPAKLQKQPAPVRRDVAAALPEEQSFELQSSMGLLNKEGRFSKMPKDAYPYPVIPGEPLGISSPSSPLSPGHPGASQKLLPFNLRGKGPISGPVTARSTIGAATLKPKIDVPPLKHRGKDMAATKERLAALVRHSREVTREMQARTAEYEMLTHTVQVPPGARPRTSYDPAAAAAADRRKGSPRGNRGGDGEVNTWSREADEEPGGRERHGRHGDGDAEGGDAMAATFSPPVGKGRDRGGHTPRRGVREVDRLTPGRDPAVPRHGGSVKEGTGEDEGSLPPSVLADSPLPCWDWEEDAGGGGQDSHRSNAHEQGEGVDDDERDEGEAGEGDFSGGTLAESGAAGADNPDREDTGAGPGGEGGLGTPQYLPGGGDKGAGQQPLAAQPSPRINTTGGTARPPSASRESPRPSSAPHDVDELREAARAEVKMAYLEMQMLGGGGNTLGANTLGGSGTPTRRPSSRGMVVGGSTVGSSSAVGATTRKIVVHKADKVAAGGGPAPATYGEVIQRMLLLEQEMGGSATEAIAAEILRQRREGEGARGTPSPTPLVSMGVLTGPCESYAWDATNVCTMSATLALGFFKGGRI